MFKLIIGIGITVNYLIITATIAQSQTQIDINVPETKNNLNPVDFSSIPEKTLEQNTEFFCYDCWKSDPLLEFELDVDAKTTVDDFANWSFTLWGGVMTDNDLGETLSGKNIIIEDSAMLGVGLSRKIWEKKPFRIDGEFQILNHFGKQSHLEFTGGFSLRWMPLSKFSIAVVEGVSFATEIPKIEDENNTRESQFLNYLAFELEYSYLPEWAVSWRLHHRSGAGGIYGGAIGGSNAYMLGIRHKF